MFRGPSPIVEGGWPNESPYNKFVENGLKS